MIKQKYQSDIQVVKQIIKTVHSVSGGIPYHSISFERNNNCDFNRQRNNPRHQFHGQ